MLRVATSWSFDDAGGSIATSSTPAEDDSAIGLVRQLDADSALLDSPPPDPGELSSAAWEEAGVAAARLSSAR